MDHEMTLPGERQGVNRPEGGDVSMLMTSMAVTIDVARRRNFAVSNRLHAQPGAVVYGYAPPTDQVPTMNELNRRFTSGDPEAVRELYHVYGRPVYAVAYRILQDRGMAEETVQLTFLQAWRAADRFDATRELGPWLFTIARRAAIDVYRRERRHRTDELGDRDVAVIPETFEGAWAAWQVRCALDELPGEERAVLQATHFEGMTHEEAARKLGIPVGTVKSRSFRAYRRLADLLSHLQEASA
ncbi:MAG TPA: RNA polymerase sigma factor [Acidimicrobiia bacterium]|jgi:RNA polymerase sigma-70 factor (ECF subfamily)